MRGNNCVKKCANIAAATLRQFAEGISSAKIGNLLANYKEGGVGGVGGGVGWGQGRPAGLNINVGRRPNPGNHAPYTELV